MEISTGDVTLSGSATDTWIFQSSSSLITGSGTAIVLSGGLCYSCLCNAILILDI